jgi:hypothetical protein
VSRSYKFRFNATNITVFSVISRMLIWGFRCKFMSPPSLHDVRQHISSAIKQFCYSKVNEFVTSYVMRCVGNNCVTRREPFFFRTVAPSVTYMSHYIYPASEIT